jgi:hypothetical protein
LNSPKIIFEGLETPMVCACCGKTIDLEKESPIICLDPGFRNYPISPDEPAEIYLECLDCHLPLDIPEKLQTLVDKELEIIESCCSLEERDAFWRALRTHIENGGL